MSEKFGKALCAFVKKAKKEIDWEWFKNAWDTCSHDTLFDVWSDAREKLSLDAPYELFDKAYQYRNPFAPKYKNARNEFLQMVVGWW